MNNAFFTYLQLGIGHILDPNGYDHIVFIVVLCAAYTAQEWRRVLWLATAFTVGHSLTLALVALQIVQPNTQLIETLIPLTILLTAIYNVLPRNARVTHIRWHYVLALAFGWIHGMGFSTFFRALMGEKNDILFPLLAFNLGIEVGQLCIVLLILGIATVFFRFFGTKERDWTLFVSGIGFGIALVLLLRG
jgi:hypothetical protein